MSNSLAIYLAVGVGGMLGATGRYLLSVFFHSGYIFPFGTLLANLIGCFLLSFIINQPLLKNKISTPVFTGISTGLIGAFTTFSTFAVETIQLGYQNFVLAIVYVFVSLFGGLLLCFIGYKFALKGQKRHEHIIN